MVDLELHLTPIPTPPPDFRSGFVGILGRPNVGKSTLLNALIGQKIAITSPVAQTTRNRLRGILTTATAQIILVDSPGIHKPHHPLGEILVNNALGLIQAVDVLLFVVDGAVPAGRGDTYIAELLRPAGLPVVLGLNKIDPLEPDGPAAPRPDVLASYQALGPDWPWVSFSALAGVGLEHLVEHLTQHLPAGPYYYPPDLVTDQPERFIIAELIREQILHHTHQEVPHSVAVVVELMETTPKITRILAAIVVERTSQKGILIGKRGQMLRTVGTQARAAIEQLLDSPVYLELFVKVEAHWRHSRHQLAELGYRPES